jgi:multiple sugar transport system permease protein
MAIVSLVIVAIPLFVYLRAVRLDSGDDGTTARDGAAAASATTAGGALA